MKIYVIRYGQTNWYFYEIVEKGELPPENLKNCEIREYKIMEK